VKSKSSLAYLLLVAFLSMSVLCVEGFSHQPTQKKEGTFYAFIVSLKQMEIEGTETYIEILFNDFPYEAEMIIVNVETRNPFSFNIGGGRCYLQRDNPNNRIYRGNITVFSYPEGSTELYPLDSYLLDFNFTVYVRFTPQKEEIPENFIKQSDLSLGYHCLIPGLDEVEYQQQANGVSSLAYDEKGTHFSSKVYLQRWYSSQLIMVVLLMSYFLLGSLLLIKPERLDQRLSVCLTLFLFAISFNFTMKPPDVYQARATLGETLTFFLLIGAGSVTILSIIERTIFEAKPKREVLLYIIEGLALFGLSSTLYSTLNYYSTLVKPYPTQSYHPSFAFLFITAILYGYLAKTIPFLVSRIQKKT
jgi:hypothetical protein